ncbi:hypothetical protein SAMN04488104_101873 [Algoriphagus faecimaris]|uniref:Uncharacterized protein n=1 Tax=Algoriphagus faecimaris TaxID=686796 RepID=A0A1G6SSX9_9BACT|nr:hypothetical protein [Algoriphagus faecimaris]SDD19908.1 hypothetical protein SAMN04488104_101873 [Algoriphagus faecimaris]
MLQKTINAVRLVLKTNVQYENRKRLKACPTRRAFNFSIPVRRGVAPYEAATERSCEMRGLVNWKDPHLGLGIPTETRLTVPRSSTRLDKENILNKINPSEQVLMVLICYFLRTKTKKSFASGFISQSFGFIPTDCLPSKQ